MPLEEGCSGHRGVRVLAGSPSAWVTVRVDGDVSQEDGRGPEG